MSLELFVSWTWKTHTITVNWDFLLLMLGRYSLGKGGVSGLDIVSSTAAQFSMLVNSNPCGFFHSSHG